VEYSTWPFGLLKAKFYLIKTLKFKILRKILKTIRKNNKSKLLKLRKIMIMMI